MSQTFRILSVISLDVPGLTLDFRQKRLPLGVVLYFLTMYSSQSLTSFDPG